MIADFTPAVKEKTWHLRDRFPLWVIWESLP